MKTLEEVRGRCFIDDEGHWLWRGAMSAGFPRLYAPDWTATKKRFDAAIANAEGRRTENALIKAAIVDAMEPVMASQPGRRAVHHIAKGEPLPKRWRAFGTCDEDACLNPDCASAGPGKAVGAQTRRTGRFKGVLKRILANRAIGRKRSHLTPELISEIRASSENGLAIAKRLNLGRTVVSRARVHGTPCHEPIGGLFSGLIREAA